MSHKKEVPAVLRTDVDARRSGSGSIAKTSFFRDGNAGKFTQPA
jgi:hypothetical protein